MSDNTEKVYRVTVTLDVYAQDSPEDVRDWLEEALHVDGMIVVRTGTPRRQPVDE